MTMSKRVTSLEHTQALNALRETQLELRETQLEQSLEMREGFALQGRRIDELEREMRGGFATMASGMGQITALLTEIRGLER
ncbi:MAG: hypothetical protein M3460_16080 [Actinomycetota bacterium]|nr:hypothetical protein [Actinomycetota bacterium]